MRGLPQQRNGVVSLCGAVNDELQRIIGQLEDAASSLNDLAMSILHDAIESRSAERPDLEKKVSQARRAVEKALHHLGAVDGSVSND